MTVLRISLSSFSFKIDKINILISLTLLIPSSLMANPISFNDYQQFNALIFNDFYGNNSDVEGRLAVGGNASLNNYSINEYRSPNRNGQVHSAESTVLTVAGNLNLSNSLVSGKANISGDISLSNATLNEITGETVDFDEAYSYLSQTAIDLASLTTNTSITTDNGKLRLQGDNFADLQVFELSSTLLSSAWGFDVVDIELSDTIIFNISGEDVQLSAANFYNYDVILDATDLGAHADNIIFNFYQANSLYIDTGIWGSVLAVNADVSCNSGVIWGQVYVQAWGSQINPCSVQINYNPFEIYETEQVVNEIYAPGNSTVFLAASMLIFFSRRKYLP
jgi:choice-of-anchor A domain-containing protein